jgi:RNA polymerase sigma-70 factor (ECF subfamily)
MPGEKPPVQYLLHRGLIAMPPEVPFADLAGRLLAGDDDAARLVVDQFTRRLVCLAASRLPQALAAKVDPEDVVQSVFKSFFVRYAEGRFKLDSWDNLWTLLTVLTVRKCGHRVEHFRAARRDVRREVTVATDPNGSDVPWEAATPEPTPAEAVLLSVTVEELLRGLVPAHRRIVQLRLEGSTIAEVSRQAGFTERTVHRVLDKVRARLAETIAASEDDS